MKIAALLMLLFANCLSANDSIARNDLNRNVTQTLSSLENQLATPRLKAELAGLLFNGTAYFTGEVYQKLQGSPGNPSAELEKAIQSTLLAFKERGINPIKYTTADSLYAAFPRSDINVPNLTSLTTIYNTASDPEVRLAISGAYRTYSSATLSLIIIGLSGLQSKDLQSTIRLDPIFNAVESHS